MEMKSGVHWPSIPYQEYASRIAKARECMAADEIDAMIRELPGYIGSQVNKD